MTVTPVGTFTQPDHSAQTGTPYKLAINNSIAVCGAIGAQFAPHEAPTPDMTIKVDAGQLLVEGALVVKTQQTSATITAPTTNPRKDRVVLDSTTGVISVVTGTEAASPSAPAIPTGKLPICQIDLTTSTTAIINSMITDERQFMSSGGSGVVHPDVPTVVTYNTAGAHVLSIPEGVNRVNVLLVGGGGGGGGHNSNYPGGGGGGGGGGCAVLALDVDVSELESVTVTIGAGGAGGNPFNGTAGGTTSFGAIVAALGGNGGGGVGSGGEPGSGGIGGGLTGFATATHRYFCDPGVIGNGGSSTASGAGGPSGSGRGAGGGSVSDSQGNVGGAYGGGGSGGHDTGSSYRAGGAGQYGLAVIWY